MTTHANSKSPNTTLKFRGDNTRELEIVKSALIFAVTTHATKLSKITFEFHGVYTRELTIVFSTLKYRGVHTRETKESNRHSRFEGNHTDL